MSDKFEQNEGEGSLFVNDRKENEQQPGFTGSLTHKGREFWVSAWVKIAGEKAKNPGAARLSLSFTEKDTDAAEGFDENNQGALFAAKRKNDDAPNYTGKVRVGGDQMFLEGYVLQSAAGVTYTKLMLKDRAPMDVVAAGMPGLEAMGDAPAAGGGGAGQDEEDNIPY